MERIECIVSKLGASGCSVASLSVAFSRSGTLMAAAMCVLLIALACAMLVHFHARGSAKKEGRGGDAVRHQAFETDDASNAVEAQVHEKVQQGSDALTGVVGISSISNFPSDASTDASVGGSVISDSDADSDRYAVSDDSENDDDDVEVEAEGGEHYVPCVGDASVASSHGGAHHDATHPLLAGEGVASDGCHSIIDTLGTCDTATPNIAALEGIFENVSNNPQSCGVGPMTSSDFSCDTGESFLKQSGISANEEIENSSLSSAAPSGDAAAKSGRTRSCILTACYGGLCPQDEPAPALTKACPIIRRSRTDVPFVGATRQVFQELMSSDPTLSTAKPELRRLLALRRINSEHQDPPVSPRTQLAAQRGPSCGTPAGCAGAELRWHFARLSERGSGGGC